ncbi:serine-rich adhesin for platelets-like [Anopheles coustani]|uniref:serine-rich adhesin for platelets-like n=1 Tax=Anopheles coustani TaxID=139045 RepID=UPI0026595802|nr:serine-rich adhesin for platelets-like [Anopheles coustani]
MDEYDIYADLNDIEEEVKKERHEVQELERRISHLEAQVLEKEHEKQALAEKNKVLSENISSLLLTAKAELQRKDNTIADFRKKCDDTVFRRGHNIVREVERVSKCTQTKYVRLIHIGVQVEQIEDEFTSHIKKYGGAREHDRDRDRDRERDRDRRDRDRDGDRNRNCERARDRNHDRGKARERFREADRSLERHRDRENIPHRQQESKRDRHREDYSDNYVNNDKRYDDRKPSSNNYLDRKSGSGRQKLDHRGATSRSKSRDARPTSRATDKLFKDEQNTIRHEENLHCADRKKRVKHQESNEQSTQTKSECKTDKDVKKLHEAAENTIVSLPASERQNIPRKIEPIVQSRTDNDCYVPHRAAVSGHTESETMLGPTLTSALSSTPGVMEMFTKSAENPLLCGEQQQISANSLIKHKAVKTTVTNFVDCIITDYSQRPVICDSAESFAESNLKNNQSSGVANDRLDDKLSDASSKSKEILMQSSIQQKPALELGISANRELSLEKQIVDVEKVPNDPKNQLGEEADDKSKSCMQTITDVPLEVGKRDKECTDENKTGKKRETVQLGIEESKSKEDLNCKPNKSHIEEDKTALTDVKYDDKKEQEEKIDYIMQETVEPMDLRSSKFDKKMKKLSEKDDDKIIKTVLAIIYDSPDPTSTKNATETEGEKILENVQCLQQESRIVKNNSVQSSLIDNEAKQRSDDEHITQKGHLKEQKSQNGVVDKQDDNSLISNERSDVGKLSQSVYSSANKNDSDPKVQNQTDVCDSSATVMSGTNVTIPPTDANLSANIGNELLAPEKGSAEEPPTDANLFANIGNELLAPEKCSAEEPSNPKPTIDSSQRSALLLEPTGTLMKTIETTKSIEEKHPEFGIEPTNGTDSGSEHQQGVRTRSKSVNLEERTGDNEKNMSIQNYFTTFTGSQEDREKLTSPAKATEVATQLESKEQEIVSHEKRSKQDTRDNSNVNMKKREKLVMQSNSDASGSIRGRLRKMFCPERPQKCDGIFSASKKRRPSLDSSPIVHKKQKNEHDTNDESTLSSAASSKLSDTFFSSIFLPIVSTLDKIHMKSQSTTLAQSSDPLHATSNVPSMAMVSSPIKSQCSPQQSLPTPMLCAFETSSRTVNDEEHIELEDSQQGCMNSSSTIEYEMEKLHFSPRHLLASSTPLIVKPQARLHHSTSSVPAQGLAGTAPVAVPDTLNSKSWTAPLGRPTPCLPQAGVEVLHFTKTVTYKAPQEHTQDKHTLANGDFCEFDSKPTCTDKSLRKHSVNKGKTASININEADVHTYESVTVSKHSSSNQPAISHKSQKSTNKAGKTTVSSSTVLTMPVMVKSQNRCITQTPKNKLLLSSSPSHRSKACLPQAEDSTTPVTSRKRSRVPSSPKRRKIDEEINIATYPTNLFSESVVGKTIIETLPKLVDKNSSEDTTLKMKEPATIIQPTFSTLVLGDCCTSTTTTNALRTFETQQQSIVTVETPVVQQCEATAGPGATSTSSEVVSPSSASTMKSLCNFSLNLSLASGSTVDTDTSVAHKAESSVRFVRDVRIVRENPKLMRVYINRPGN